ncbi:hypothetical protein AB2B38_005930 [Balneola sp. MJW-20]|uniref:hypothetical protein n=1 Tax=Gracilimonas aurantiaca TaxID=3234185 RepID=UPI0034664F5A
MNKGTNSKSRLRDIHIWDQPWFIDLETDYKLLWSYMNDKCDNIGIYAHSRKKCRFDIDVDIESEQIIKIFNIGSNKVMELDESTFLIIDFCRFQYCKKSELLPKSNIHLSYIRDIIRADLIEFFALNQPDVVSFKTLAYIKSCEDGLLELKPYSNKKEKDINHLSPYEEAISKALEYYSRAPYNWDPKPKKNIESAPSQLLPNPCPRQQDGDEDLRKEYYSDKNKKPNKVEYQYKLRGSENGKGIPANFLDELKTRISCIEENESETVNDIQSLFHGIEKKVGGARAIDALIDGCTFVEEEYGVITVPALREYMMHIES